MLLVGASAIFIRLADKKDLAVPAISNGESIYVHSVTLCDLALDLYEKYGSEK